MKFLYFECSLLARYKSQYLHYAIYTTNREQQKVPCMGN